MNLPPILILLTSVTSVLCAEDVGSAKNNFQCNSVPSELFSRCRKTIAANKPFFYGYLEDAEDCSSLADSTERNLCKEVVDRGNRFAIQTDEYEAQPRPHHTSKSMSEPETQASQMERIAKATERTALVSTIQLVLFGIGFVGAVVLVAWKGF